MAVPDAWRRSRGAWLVFLVPVVLFLLGIAVLNAAAADCPISPTCGHVGNASCPATPGIGCGLPWTGVLALLGAGISVPVCLAAFRAMRYRPLP